MNKLLLLSFCLASFLGKAQVTIVEEIYVKDSKPVGFNYLKHTHNVVIHKGKKMGGLVAASQTNNIYSYSITGEKKTIVENEKLYNCSFSPSENTFRMLDISKSMFKIKVKYLINGNSSPLFDFDASNAYPKYFKYKNFTDKYELKLTNQKNNSDINFEKDNLTLKTVDIATRKEKVYKLDKPSIARLIGANLVEPRKSIGLNYILNEDESFDLITKSISSDYSKTTLYKTNYSTVDGKIVSDIAFELNLEDKKLVYSNNNGGFIGYPANKSLPFFDDDLSINNFITDSNGDVYIYGLYGDKIAELNDETNPKGYYVFKFDKMGKIIWKSINKIDEKKFNDKHYMYFTETNLSIINDQLCFYAFVNENQEYLNYGIIDMNSGKLTKSNNIIFHEFMSRVGFGNDFFKLDYEYKDVKELKNKKFNLPGIIAYDLNTKFSNYVKAVKIKNETHFLTLFSDIGIWLIETDNDNYYKVSYFKD